MENDKKTSADYVLSLKKNGRPHYPVEIQENVTSTYEKNSDFVNTNFLKVIT